MAVEAQGELLGGRYRKLETIGVGGMAKVYLAEDERLGRRVAVKRLHADSPGDAAERFEREARLGASLNHPNLVSIFDIATDGESVLIVMEYVAGETLRDAIAAGPLPVDEALEIMGDVAAALDHAHAHGVVHRDVKPANILVRRRDGAAKLADLGIATAAEGTRITRSGMVLGTAAYMSPEQLDGRPAEPASDIYSLATVTYEALTGKKARTGSTPMEIAHRVANDPPPDLREDWPDAPEGAAEALRRAMSPRPADRPSSARRLIAELEREFAREPGQAGAAAAAIGSTPTGDAEPAVGGDLSGTPDTASREYAPAASEPPRPAERERRAPPPGPRAAAVHAPAFRARRRLPSWVPAAAVLVAFCLIGAIVLATTGGDDGKADRSEGAGSAAKTPSSDRQGSKGDSAADGGGGSASAPASGGSTQQAGGGGSAGGSSGGSAAALNDQGYRLMQAGQYDEAIPILQRAVSSFSEGSTDLTYAYALYNLGRSLRLAGRPDEAVPILERRLRIPNQTDTVRRELEAARKAAG